MKTPINKQVLRRTWADEIEFDPIEMFTFGRGGRMYLKDPDTISSEVRSLVKVRYKRRGVFLKFPNKIRASRKLAQALKMFGARARAQMPHLVGLVPGMLGEFAKYGSAEVDEFINILESHEAHALMRQVPIEYWIEPYRLTPNRVRLILGTESKDRLRDRTPEEQEKYLRTFWSQTVRQDILEFFEYGETGTMFIRDLQTMCPHVRRQLSAMSLDRSGCVWIGSTDKMAASILMARALGMFDCPYEKVRSGSGGIMSVIQENLPYASWDEAGEFRELVESKAFVVAAAKLQRRSPGLKAVMAPNFTVLSRI